MKNEKSNNRKTTKIDLAAASKKALLNRAEAAGMLNISVPKLDKMIKRGEIAKFQLGSRVLILMSAIDAFIKANMPKDSQDSQNKAA